MGKVIGALVGIAVGLGIFSFLQPHWTSWIFAGMALASLFQFISALLGDRDESHSKSPEEDHE